MNNKRVYRSGAQKKERDTKNENLAKAAKITDFYKANKAISESESLIVGVANTLPLPSTSKIINEQNLLDSDCDSENLSNNESEDDKINVIKKPNARYVQYSKNSLISLKFSRV